MEANLEIPKSQYPFLNFTCNHPLKSIILEQILSITALSTQNLLLLDCPEPNY